MTIIDINANIEMARREKINKTIKSASRFIWVTFQKAGFHYYQQAASDPVLADVRYLANQHRHLFKFRITIEVQHSDREIEFHQFLNYCESLFDTQTIDINGKSVEMLADDLYEHIIKQYPGRAIEIQISEDGEAGCMVFYDAPQLQKSA